MLAQVRLAWWRDAVGKLPGAGGHPVAVALAAEWRGGTEVLIGLVDGWEAVAVGGTALATVDGLARVRAEACAACARVSVPEGAARCWTLATLAPHAPDAAALHAMREAAGAALPPALPRALRPLAVLDGLGRRALLRGGGPLLGDRMSPLAAMRLGIFGR